MRHLGDLPAFLNVFLKDLMDLPTFHKNVLELDIAAANSLSVLTSEPIEVNFAENELDLSAAPSVGRPRRVWDLLWAVGGAGKLLVAGVELLIVSCSLFSSTRVCLFSNLRLNLDFS